MNDLVKKFFRGYEQKGKINPLGINQFLRFCYLGGVYQYLDA